MYRKFLLASLGLKLSPDRRRLAAISLAGSAAVYLPPPPIFT